jgi:hypothetical protein
MTARADLFGIDQEGSTARTESPRVADVRPFFDAYLAAARKKLNAPPEWEWYALEVLTPTDDTLVTGGIPNAGGRSRRWRGVEPQKCVVTRADVAAVNDEYERDTGLCCRCAGTGETLASASVDRGNTYRKCARCVGTGKTLTERAPVPAVDPSRSTPNAGAVS